jgi:hypothetical protein
VDTIRRRVRRGELPARRDAQGRNLVDIADAPTASAASVAAPRMHVQDDAALAAARADAAQLRAHLAARDAVLAEVRGERDHLWSELERRGVELAEMRRLLGNAQQQLSTAQTALLAAPVPAPESPTEGAREHAESALGAPELVPEGQHTPTAEAVLKAAGPKLGKKARRRLAALFGR